MWIETVNTSENREILSVLWNRKKIYPEDIIHEGTSIKGKTGINRRPDVWVEDAITGKVKKVYEAARSNKNGTFVSRENKKMSEIHQAWNLMSF